MRSPVVGLLLVAGPEPALGRPTLGQDARKGEDQYLYALEHFELVAKQECQQYPARRAQAERCLAAQLLPPLIDARTVGNVSRFLNHSHQQPNLDVQQVFTDARHSSIFYR